MGERTYFENHLDYFIRLVRKKQSAIRAREREKQFAENKKAKEILNKIAEDKNIDENFSKAIKDSNEDIL